MTHANTRIFSHDVLLAGFFEPVCRWQRLIEALSTHDAFRNILSVERLPRSTLSDALQRIDLQLLRNAIGELALKCIPAAAAVIAILLIHLHTGRIGKWQITLAHAT